MDFSTVKGISIPQGDVLRINDGNGNLLWKKHLYDYKDLVDALVSYGESTGTDENGRYVTCTGSIISNKRLFNLNQNKNYNIYVKGYNINTASPNVSNIYSYSPTLGNTQCNCSMAGTTTYAQKVASVWGTWQTSSARIYDFYIEEA